MSPFSTTPLPLPSGRTVPLAGTVSFSGRFPSSWTDQIGLAQLREILLVAPNLKGIATAKAESLNPNRGELENQLANTRSWRKIMQRAQIGHDKETNWEILVYDSVNFHYSRAGQLAHFAVP
jgi:hypothetical protein